MNKLTVIISTLILLALLVLSGCSTSYDSCKDDCVRYCTEPKPSFSEAWDEFDRCRKECYDECRGIE